MYLMQNSYIWIFSIEDSNRVSIENIYFEYFLFRTNPLIKANKIISNTSSPIFTNCIVNLCFSVFVLSSNLNFNSLDLTSINPESSHK